jgi:hypothetical protein
MPPNYEPTFTATMVRIQAHVDSLWMAVENEHMNELADFFAGRASMPPGSLKLDELCMQLVFAEISLRRFRRECEE